MPAISEGLGHGGAAAFSRSNIFRQRSTGFTSTGGDISAPREVVLEGKKPLLDFYDTVRARQAALSAPAAVSPVA